MRICIRCKVEQEIDQFNFKNRIKDIRSAHCKSCSRKYIQDHYSKNRQYYLEKAKKRNAMVERAVRLFVWNYFSTHPCIDCGETDPVVLEFDHIKEKTLNISDLMRDASLKKIEEEIAKCVVRCANCHRRKTAKQYNWYKYMTEVKAPIA